MPLNQALPAERHWSVTPQSAALCACDLRAAMEGARWGDAV